MAQLRAPGIYYEASEQRIPPLELGRTGVPVFLGITRRGPLDAPVRITSEDRFLEIFGEPVHDTFLTTCLKGFFGNGGEECFVLRVARLEGEPGEDVARRASVVLLDRAGQPVLAVEALDQGTWGNDLRVTVRESPDSPRTFLTRDADRGATHIQVKGTHGLAPGTLIHVSDRNNEQWVEVGGVEGKVIQLRDPLIHAFASGAPTYVKTRTVDLSVGDHERSERFERLSTSGASPRFIERTINDQSRLVRVKALRPDTPPALSLPADLADARLGGGSDGVSDLGPDDFIGHDRGPGDRRGLMGLVEFPKGDLVAMPDLMAAYMHSKRFRSPRDIEVVQEAAISLCERSSNRFALLDMPPGGDFEDALHWRQLFDSAHAAFYYPWVVVLEGGKRRKVPPSAHVAGIFAASDRRHGVHKAPANEVLEGVVDLEVLLQDSHLASLNQAGINCLRPFGPRGLRVWGARTASSDPEWRHLNVRRTVSAIAATIEHGTQWAVFEPNAPALWKRLTRFIVGFLMGLRERGMLAGDRPEDAFFVKCDSETNPREEVDRGMLVTRIGLAVTRPVEFIVFHLSQRLENEAQQEEV